MYYSSVDNSLYFFSCFFFFARSDDVELHVISLTYKDLAGLSKGEKGGEAIDKATFLQNFPVPGLVGGGCVHTDKDQCSAFKVAWMRSFYSRNKGFAAI